MENKIKKEIEKHLGSASPEAKLALIDLQKKIQDAAPDAVLSISYGLPAFRYKGRPLVAFAASRNHCGFYVMSPAVMEKYKAKLKGYNTSKGTIRFSAHKPLPTAIVKKLVKARVEELDKKLTKK